MTEALAMLMQDGGQELRIDRVALGDDLPVTNQPTFDFGVVYFVPKLCITRRRFATADDLGMRFKQTDHFRCRRHTPFRQDALRGLGDDLLYQWHECGQLLRHPPCAWIGIAL